MPVSLTKVNNISGELPHKFVNLVARGRLRPRRIKYGSRTGLNKSDNVISRAEVNQLSLITKKHDREYIEFIDWMFSILKKLGFYNFKKSKAYGLLYKEDKKVAKFLNISAQSVTSYRTKQGHFPSKSLVLKLLAIEKLYCSVIIKKHVLRLVNNKGEETLIDYLNNKIIKNGKEFSLNKVK